MQEILQKQEELLTQQKKVTEGALRMVKDNEEKFEKKLEEKQEQINENRKVLDEINQKLEKSHLENDGLKESLTILQLEQNRTMTLLESQKDQLAEKVQQMNDIMKEKEEMIKKLSEEKNSILALRNAEAKSKNRAFWYLIGGIAIISVLIGIMLLWRVSKVLAVLTSLLLCFVIMFVWIVWTGFFGSSGSSVAATVGHAVVNQLLKPQN